MALKIGINGLGRIGKLVLRLSLQKARMEVVHINDKMDTALMAHLLKYDSIHGKIHADIQYDANHIIINGRSILVTNQINPNDIPWETTGVAVVVESSGKFKTKESLKGHFAHGIKRVILSAPPDDYSIERTVVLGVNEHDILASDKIISNASCTTNCVAVMLKVLQDEWGIEKAFMNTVHPTTNNQNLQDGFHSDYRRARSAINNIIPTTSSAVRCVHRIFPELESIFDGFATRVPVIDCSFVEVNAILKKGTSVDRLNASFEKYSHLLSPYLEYCNDPIVSSDITDNSHSAIFDALATKVIGDNFVQILAWYDNEYGYSSRIIDLIQYTSLS